MPKKGAKIVLKVLDSAIANAYNNFNADVDDLKVTRIEVDPAPMLKRFHARAKGRGVRSPSATVTSWFKCPTASERPNGSKSKSDWYSPRHHARLDVEVVCAFEELRREHSHRLLVRKF
jgi:hypothetical protein